MGNDIVRSDWGPGGEHRSLVPTESTPTDWSGGPGSYAASRDRALAEYQAPVTNLQRALSLGPWLSDPAGYSHRIKVASNYAWGLLESLDDRSANALRTSFDRLPMGVQVAFISELSSEPARSTKVASAAAMEAFQRSQVGHRLVQFWGGRAERNVGMVQSRLRRIESQLSQHEVDAAWAWIDSLPDRAVEGVMCLLAGK